MTRAIGLALIGMLVLLAALEVARYQRAARLEDELPYPRRRLIRRIGVSIIFSLLVAAVVYWPAAAPAAAQLTLMLAVLLGTAFGLFLLWRDLHETSRAVVRHATRLSEESGSELLRTFESPAAPLRTKDPTRRREEGFSLPPEVDTTGENGKTEG